MKKLYLTLFLCLACLVAHAQSTNTYRSVNFYGNGQTEYLRIVGKDWKNSTYYYYTSQKPQRVQLTVLRYREDCVPNSECTSFVTIAFPNDKEVYTLIIAPGSLICEDKTGKQQSFEWIQGR